MGIVRRKSSIDDVRALQTAKSKWNRRDVVRIHSLTPPSYCRTRVNQIPAVTKRANSFHSEIPVDYRQYLRATGQSAHLYAEQTTLESSLGYLP
jgi:hypothetical protein